MTDTEAYRATLARLEGDLQKAERHADNLRAGIAAIRAILGESPAAATSSAERTAPTTRTIEAPRFYGGTMTMKDWARYVLREANGRAMRVREIFDAMIALGFAYEKGYDVFRGSMTPTLERDTETFYKVGKGLYTVREFAHKHQQASQVGMVDLA